MSERYFSATAEDLLTDKKFGSLRIEIQYMEGYEPNQVAIRNLRLFLLRLLHKPGGISITQRRIRPVAKAVLTSGELYVIKQKNRRIFNKGRQLSLYILYTNGEYEKKYALGMAFQSSYIVIFGKAVRQGQALFSFPSPATIETTLLLHETGHLLGLVNNGITMKADHQDSLHSGHCINPECIMYWGTSIKPMFGPLKMSPILSFDAACLEDLRRSGGR